MMMPRLLLAQKILSEQGVFFISIDDREMATLTILLREIFGLENHIGTIKWRKKRKPSFLDKHFSSVIEYVLVFAKNRHQLAKLKGLATEEKTRPVLNASNAIVKRVLKKGIKACCQDGIYPAGKYKNKTLEIELLSEVRIENGLLQGDVPVQGRFRVAQDILDKTVFITKKFGLRRRVLPEEQSFKHATDDATVNYETNEDAEVQLRNLFGDEKVFDYPKPVGLLKKLLRMYSSPKENILCLDFFAGSATLAQAVHEINQEGAGGNKYTFCCVQNEELTPKQGQFKSIADIAQARIQMIEEKHQIFPRCKIFLPKESIRFPE
jgi:adenine-specific DNA-methyltransferase